MEATGEGADVTDVGEMAGALAASFCGDGANEHADNNNVNKKTTSKRDFFITSF